MLQFPGKFIFCITGFEGNGSLKGLRQHLQYTRRDTLRQKLENCAIISNTFSFNVL